MPVACWLRLEGCLSSVELAANACQAFKSVTTGGKLSLKNKSVLNGDLDIIRLGLGERWG